MSDDEDLYKDCDADYFKKYTAAMITDLVKDPKSNAETHVSLDSDGFYVQSSKPPQSIADHQSEIRGYVPLKFFDRGNDAKKVIGVHAPHNNFCSYMIKGQLADKIRAEVEVLRSQGRYSTHELEY